MAEQIESILSNGFSVSLYPPGTRSRQGYDRRTYLAVSAGPLKVGQHDPTTTFRSASAEGSTPQEAVARLHDRIAPH